MLCICLHSRRESRVSSQLHERTAYEKLVPFNPSRQCIPLCQPSHRKIKVEVVLLGAIRLPNNAFKRNAGTEVTTDIVMLRKLRTGESPGGPAWKLAAQYTNDQNQEFFINEYFVVNPESHRFTVLILTQWNETKEDGLGRGSQVEVLLAPALNH